MYDIITIGTATRDVFLQSPLFKAVKDPHFTREAGFPTGEAECFAFGGKIDIGKPVFGTGGGATNAAVTFARQGLQAAAILSIGKDESGKAIVAELKKENVKPVIAYAKDLHTAYSTLLLSDTGERTILVYRGASEKPGRTNLKNLQARWAYISPGSIPLKTMQKMVSRLKEGGTKIAMNPSGFYIKTGLAAIEKVLSMLDVVIMNREEAASLTSVNYDDVPGIFKKLDEVIKGIAVMTDGPRGVKVSDGKLMYSAGIFPEQKLVDRTGAGDAFGSGFVAGLMARPMDIPYAIRLASANATSVVEYIGAKQGILTKEKFDNEERWREFKIDVTNLA